MWKIDGRPRITEDAYVKDWYIKIVWETKWTEDHFITVYGDTEDGVLKLAEQTVYLLNEYS